MSGVNNTTEYCNFTKPDYDKWKEIYGNSTFTPTLGLGDNETLSQYYQLCNITNKYSRENTTHCPMTLLTECKSMNVTNGENGTVTTSSNIFPFTAESKTTEICECSTNDSSNITSTPSEVTCTCIHDWKKNATSAVTNGVNNTTNNYLFSKNCTIDNSTSNMNCTFKDCLSNLHMGLFNITSLSNYTCNDTSTVTLQPKIIDNTTNISHTSTTSTTSGQTSTLAPSGTSSVSSNSASGSSASSSRPSSPSTTTRTPTTAKASASSGATGNSSSQSSSPQASPTPTATSNGSTDTSSKSTTSTITISQDLSSKQPSSSSASQALSSSAEKLLSSTRDMLASLVTGSGDGSSEIGSSGDEMDATGTTSFSGDADISQSISKLLTTPNIEDASRNAILALKQVQSSSLPISSGSSSLGNNNIFTSSIFPLALFIFYLLTYMGILRKEALRSPKDEKE